MILAIDPGTAESAWILFDGNEPIAFGKNENQSLREKLPYLMTSNPKSKLVLEQVKSYGMPIGDTVLDTVLWTGRLIERVKSQMLVPVLAYRIPRKTVVTHICGSARANDSNVRTALVDRWGGEQKAIGTKALGYGPLHGVTKDIWSALAIAITAHERPELLEPVL